MIAAVLGWGYWHAATHAYLDLQIHDYGLRSEYRLYDTPHHAKVELFDAARGLLAQAQTVEPLGYSTALHPQLGDCSGNPTQPAYSACYAQYSRWVSAWASRAQFASLRVGDCAIRDIPVRRSRSMSGWALWWVPLPHVGGTPYEYIGLTLEVDSRACALAHPD